MTNHVARLYVAAASVFVLFLAWAVIATHPWPTKSVTASANDPRIVALNARTAAIRSETVAVRQLLAQRRTQPAQTRLTAAQTAPAALPPVRVVTLPPLTITRTS